MTAMPEAKLTREAELPYALIAMVTDYDCRLGNEAPVEVGGVIAQLGVNAAKARATIAHFLAHLPKVRARSLTHLACGPKLCSKAALYRI